MLSFLLFAFCFQCIISKEYFVFTHELKRFYDSLKQKEHALVKNIKKKYPKIHKNSWKNYHNIGNKAFNAIKKDYLNYPACDLLDQFKFDCLDEHTMQDFLTAYARCSCERHGIDPEKILIKYEKGHENGHIESNNNKEYVSIKHFEDHKKLIDFCERKDCTSYNPTLYIDPCIYKNKNDLNLLLQINKNIVFLADSYDIKKVLLKHLVIAYYSIEVLFDRKILKEWGPNELYYGDFEQKIHTIFEQDALIKSVLQNPELLDCVCNYLEERDQQTNEIKKVLKFLYKIKKLNIL